MSILYLYGVLARILSFFIPIKKNLWIFGSDYGKNYREGSKYLIEYMLKNHPEYECCFITQSKNVYNTLKEKSIPVELNTSWKGLMKTSQAECVFTTQFINDIYFTYPKTGRRYFYLVHGQPLKKAFYALENKTSNNRRIFDIDLITRINKKIKHLLCIGYKLDDVDFVSASSDFLRTYMEKDFGQRVPVKVLGMPRNDALFQPERFKEESWITGLDEKFIITYMPTHRAYGKGEVTPTPFQNRPDIQNWMKENNVVLLVKNHPNMIKQCKSFYNSECIIDITTRRIDPQVVIYHSDVLVTDFSSVWMDYLLLRRPVIFYIYDDFEKNDVGCHYDIRENPPGHFCYSEEQFFEIIKNTRKNYNQMKPNEETLNRFHKYVDGNSCERYYQEIASKH